VAIIFKFNSTAKKKDGVGDTYLTGLGLDLFERVDHPNYSNCIWPGKEYQVEIRLQVIKGEK